MRVGERPLPASSALQRMLASIGHRGPDDSGDYLSQDIHFGAVRLAIIDPKSGSQPVAGCRGRIHAVLNGEIYNHHYLRGRLLKSGHHLPSECDTEILPHLYEEYGSSLVELLSGMFSAVVWDEVERKLLLARDRMGIKPLYYHIDHDFLVFASEVKAIFASGLVKPELDPRSIDDLFSLSYPCPPRTMFRNVFELRPAHIMSFSLPSRALRFRRYWECPFPPAGQHRQITRAEAVEELAGLLRSSVYRHLMSDVPIGLYLSGGIDSSAIAAIYHDVTGDSPETFSMGFDTDGFDESPEIREIAGSLGAKSNFIECGADLATDFERMIWHMEVPLQFPLAAPLISLAGLARSKGFRVVLTGEGADELFGGYDCFRADKMRRILDRPGIRRIRPYFYSQLYQWSGMPSGTSERMRQNHESSGEIQAAYGGVFPPWYDMWSVVGIDRQNLLGVDDRLVRPVSEPPEEFLSLLPPDLDRLDPLDAGIAVEFVTRLPSWILLIGDRSSMANSVEARVPFLDQELVEFVASLSPQLKMPGFREKSLLRCAVKGMLPRSVAKRRKRPFFTPITEWFFGGRPPEFVEENLSTASILDSGLFNPSLVAKFRRDLRVAHPRSLYRRQLEWTLLLVLGTQTLHRQFVRQRGGGFLAPALTAF